MADVSNIQREIKALNRRQAAQLASSLNPTTPAGGPPARALVTGSRVLDLVTGQEGVIVNATTEHIIIGASSDSPY